MSEKQTTKKAKRVVNEDNTPALWGDIYEVLGYVDGITRSMAHSALLIKESGCVNKLIPTDVMAGVNEIATAVFNAKRNMKEILDVLPGKEKDVVLEKDYALYLQKYSDVISIKDDILVPVFDKYIDLITTVGDIANGTETKSTSDQQTNTESMPE